MIEANNDSRFTISDLTLAETITKLGEFDITKIIHPGARILNCGSGIYRTFEKELLKVIPDLSIISIDPSLGVVTIDQEGSKTTQGYQIYLNLPQGVVYEPLNDTQSNKIARGNQAIQFDRERKANLTQIPYAVAANGIHLPFKNQMFDTIIDIRGPMLYLKQEYQIMKQYLFELKRTLKTDGFVVCIFLDPIQREIITSLKMCFAQWAKNTFIITN
jgi:hypothetical protein